MSYSLSANLTAKKNALEGGVWVWCFDLQRDSSNTSYYTNAEDDVTYNSQLYTSRAMSFEPPEADSQGTIHTMKVVLHDPQLTDTAYVESGKYFDQPMVARYVNTDYLSAEADQKYYRGTIISVDGEEQYDEDSGRFQWVLQFSCGIYNLRHAKIPNDKFCRTRCRWRFKSDECGYSGGESTCDLTLTTCENTMSNNDRFGGFPSIPVRNPS